MLPMLCDNRLIGEVSPSALEVPGSCSAPGGCAEEELRRR